MSHIHDVVDSDTHFVIDPLTRVISTTSEKLNLSVGDHNSEIYTFEIPKIVEGHDMSSCTRIEVHYNNVSKDKKNIGSDVYLCTDSQVTGDTLTFSWLISRNATKYKGTLQFSIRFVCVDDGDAVVYDWRTATFKKVFVGDVVYNDAVTEETVSDTIEQIKDEIIQIVPTKVGQLENDTGYLTEHQSLDNYPTKTEMSDAIAAIPEQVQSDLSVNDESNPAFVKGVIRQESLPEGYPCKKETERRAVIDASDISWSFNMGYHAYVSPVDEFINFVVGNEYIIETDDTFVSVVCDYENDISNGDLHIYSSSDNKNYRLNSNNSTSKIVKVTEIKYDIKRIDEDFIPLSVAMPKGYVDSGAVPIVLSASSGIPTEWGVEYLPENIVSSVNGVIPSNGNVTLDVYTKGEIKNMLAPVATSGKYLDLEGIPVSKIVSEPYESYSLNTPTTYNGNKFRYSSSSVFTSEFFESTYKNAMLSFSFNKSPAYGSVEFFRTDYQYPNSESSIWGNASLYDSRYQDTGETWCVYIENGNRQVIAFCSDGDIYSIHIYHTETEVTQLSEEFIPSSIARSSDIPTDDHINELINTALGVIENGTY